ncbi:hypothetical protein V6N11_001476 [Hibiscus sabdariffa]|uniref:Uncharacterized protein n=1 Tax=Hibiscus sabdariffa TaxID=183260 RepID=A0ABR2S0C6_9ROSI
MDGSGLRQASTSGTGFSCSFDSSVARILGVASVQQETYNEGYQGYNTTANNAGYVSQSEAPVQTGGHIVSSQSGGNVASSSVGVSSHVSVLHSIPFAPISAPMSFISTASHWSSSNDEAWYSDTGATHHVTHDSTNFQIGALYTGCTDLGSVAQREAHS